ncbi:MAG: NADH-flavin oxidoreductase, Old yellow enzyme family [Firmicutes bacterium]|nr:NADH-flavin oxidoreductase, Old yellow enzyme family [Bacillota bacterium]
MSRKFPNLFSSINVGTHTYKNRIIAAPIYCGTFATFPPLSPMFFQAFEARAKGGYAQVTIGETPVDFEYANREPFPPIDYTDYNDPAFGKLKKVVDNIKSNGGMALIELCHCGESKLFIPGLKNPIGPMGYVREDGVEVQAMDEVLMQKVIANFVISAKFMKAAGFDGVMIHAGHGWLIHQFLSSRTNARTDEYGGSLANRAKFPIQLIKSVRDAMGKDFIVEIRVSGDERIENGMGIEEVTEFCKMVEEFADIIHVSVGLYRNPILSGQFSSMFEPHGLNAEMSEAIKKAVSIPVAVVGGINSPELAEKLILEGKCDFVALARQLTADSEFANKAEAGNAEDITPCLRCYKCFPGPLEDNIDDLASLFGCTVNPEAFYYDTNVLNSKPSGSRNVLVIGGGIAGMEAAIVAADRGHKVTLVEKSDSLGGLLKFTDTDAHKDDLRAFKDLLVRRVNKRDIKVVFGKEVTTVDIRSFGADAVILAVGSAPIMPAINGIENAIKALQVYDDLNKVGQRVIMVGGGLVGCEVGLHLAEHGRNVTIIEMGDKVAPDCYPMHRLALVHEMDKMLHYRTSVKCTAIAPNGVTVVDRTGKEEFMVADTVIYALGMQANKATAESLRTAAVGVPVYEIGDCVRAAKVYEALREGFVAAMSIL